MKHPPTLLLERRLTQDSPPGPAQPRGRLWKGRAACREGKLGTQLSILGHNLKGRIIPHF